MGTVPKTLTDMLKESSNLPLEPTKQVKTEFNLPLEIYALYADAFKDTSNFKPFSEIKNNPLALIIPYHNSGVKNG